MSLPPGPSAPPAVQTIRWLLGPIDFMNGCRRRFGDAFSVMLLGFQTPMVMISDPGSIPGALPEAARTGCRPGAPSRSSP